MLFNQQELHVGIVEFKNF